MLAQASTVWSCCCCSHDPQCLFDRKMMVQNLPFLNSITCWSIIFIFFSCHFKLHTYYKIVTWVIFIDWAFFNSKFGETSNNKFLLIFAGIRANVVEICHSIQIVFAIIKKSDISENFLFFETKLVKQTIANFEHLYVF